MWTKIKCLLRQRSKKCPYESILEKEQIIRRLQEARKHVKQVRNELESYMLQGDGAKLMYDRTQYYDGFSWGRHQEKLGVPSSSLTGSIHPLVYDTTYCGYKVGQCEQLLAAKKSMIPYLRNQLLQEISVYNTYVSLIRAVQQYHAQRASQNSPYFIEFMLSPETIKAIYFNIEKVKRIEGTSEVVAYFVGNKERTKRESLQIGFKRATKVLERTCEASSRQKHYIIELIDPLEWVEPMDEFALTALEHLIKVLNAKVLSNEGLITGVWVNLKLLSLESKIQVMSYFRARGYRVLGQLNEQGEFAQEQLLYKAIELTKSKREFLR